jgi:TRAP-type transport system periplasmic protein
MGTSRGRDRGMAIVLIVLAAGGLAAGCKAGVDKSGGSGIRMLTLALDDPAGRPSGQQVEVLASELRRTSAGRLRVAVTYSANGPDGTTPSFDQRIADQVHNGRYDMGLVPARAWDELGVASLEPLSVPFLVTTDEQLAAVISDPVSREMLAGLRSTGMTGLTLLPEAIRHPIGFAAPFTRLRDFAGITIRAPKALTTYASLRSLDANPSDLNGDSLKAAVSDGSVAGAESEMLLLGSVPGPSIITANIALYAKANVLAISTKVLRSLSDDQRTDLLAAAAATQRRSIRALPPEATAAKNVCAAGDSVVLAAKPDVAEIRAAVAPVRAAVATDRVAGPLLTRVEKVVARHPGTNHVSACTGRRPSADAATGDVVDPVVLNGVWRFVLTSHQLLAAGLSDDFARRESGVNTIRLDNGRYTWDWLPPIGPQTCNGHYTTTTTTVTFTEEGDCTAISAADYQVDGDRLLFRNGHSLNTGDANAQLEQPLWYRQPWQLVRPVKATAGPPEGLYRWDVPPARLVAAGVEPGEVSSNGGLKTFAISHRRFTAGTQSPDPDVPVIADCHGDVRGTGHRVTFVADDTPECGKAAGGALFSATWRTTANGLEFTEITPADPLSLTLWGGAPWRRISPAP